MWIIFWFEYGMTRKEVDLDFKNRRESFRWKKHLQPRLRSLYQGNDFKERAKRNRCRESERRKESHCPRNLYRIRYSFDILLREASSIPLKITGIRATLESNDNEPRSSFLCVIEWHSRLYSSSILEGSSDKVALFEQRYAVLCPRFDRESNRPSLSSGKEFAGMLFASRTERFLCELLIFNGRSFVHEKGTPWFIRVKGNRISYVCACVSVCVIRGAIFKARVIQRGARYKG